MPSNAELANQVSELVDTIRQYVGQQRNWLTGTENAVIPGQPAPGYYPITDPSGIVTWIPSIPKLRSEISAFTILELAGANSITVNATHNNKVVLVNNAGGSTAVTLTFPTGLGKGFNAIYIWTGTQSTFTFAGATGVTLVQDQGLTRARARGSVVTAIATANNNIVLSGSMAVGTAVV